MKKKSTKYYTLLLLVLMFAAPGIAAYIFYQHPGWLGATKVNRGTLLKPAVTLPVLDAQKKWRIILWIPGTCDAACLQQLDTLARIRLALGRKLYQVDQWLVIGPQTPPLEQETKATIKELDFQVAQLSADELKAQKILYAESKVFLADPNNYLILSYPPLVNPDDVYRDLKLLLNTTEKNG